MLMRLKLASLVLVVLITATFGVMADRAMPESASSPITWSNVRKALLPVTPGPGPAAPTAVAAGGVKPALSFPLQLTAPTGVSLPMVLPTGSSCPDVCADHDLTVVNGGTSKQALCAVRDLTTGNYQYGTWFEDVEFDDGYKGHACIIAIRGYPSLEDGDYYFTADFHCGCQSASWTYKWGGASCTTGSTAASTKPAICRVHKYRSTGPYVMGHYNASTNRCYFPPSHFGANDEVMHSVSGFNGANWGMQALCSTPKAEASAKVCLSPAPLGTTHCWLDLGGLTTGFFPAPEGLLSGDPDYVADKQGVPNMKKNCAAVLGTTVSKLRSALSIHYSGGAFERDDWYVCDNNCCDFVNAVLKTAGSSADVDGHFSWDTFINGPCNK